MYQRILVPLFTELEAVLSQIAAADVAWQRLLHRIVQKSSASAPMGAPSTDAR